MTTYLGKNCSFGLPRVPFVNCRQFMYLVISLLVLRAGCGIWLYQFLIIAYLFTLPSNLSFSAKLSVFPGFLTLSTSLRIPFSVRQGSHNLFMQVMTWYNDRRIQDAKSPYHPLHFGEILYSHILKIIVNFSTKVSVFIWNTICSR